MELISFNGVNKSYFVKKQEVKVLTDVNISINYGEFIVILGASGQGKTTLLNMMGGIDCPSSGQIIINGLDITKLSSDELAEWRSYNVGIVFQAYNLMPFISAVENTALPLVIKGISKRYREKRAMELLRKVGLKSRYDYNSNLLSGGEQQRVAIARALINNPKILIADEPTGDLDIANATEVMDIIYELYKERNTTIIMATHNPNYAKYADKVIYITKGQVEVQRGVS